MRAFVSIHKFAKKKTLAVHGYDDNQLVSVDKDLFMTGVLHGVLHAKVLKNRIGLAR